jgi:hypothetical protein
MPQGPALRFDGLFQDERSCQDLWPARLVSYAGGVVAQLPVAASRGKPADDGTDPNLDLTGGTAA